MSRNNFLFTTCLFIPACVTCFCIISTSPIRLQHASKLNSNRFDFEKNAERRALENGVSGGTGETIAGAVLGGLVLGPFGALFGASVGSNFGARSAVDKAKKEELNRMGITEDMLTAAREIGSALENANEGLKATQDSLTTQQEFARRLDADAERVYNRAKMALSDKDEDEAKDLLYQRQKINEKLMKSLESCKQEKKRLAQMEDNVRSIEERSIEIESLLRRSIGAKSLQESSDQLLLQDNDFEDPLLKKFKDMGI